MFIVAPKNHRLHIQKTKKASKIDEIYKICKICGWKFCVNNQLKPNVL
jgi:hypothetical protein